MDNETTHPCHECGEPAPEEFDFCCAQCAEDAEVSDLGQEWD